MVPALLECLRSHVSETGGKGCVSAQEKMLEQMQVFNVGEDCPVFSQMFQFCQVSSFLMHAITSH